MISLLIITHEELGAAYTSLAGHFFADGDFSHIRILNVEKSDDHGDIIRHAQDLVQDLDVGNGVLILTDIFGATPCNAALKMVQPPQSAMVTGLNAPMLIKAVSNHTRQTDLATFAQCVKEAGINGIMSFTEPLCD